MDVEIPHWTTIFGLLFRTTIHFKDGLPETSKEKPFGIPEAARTFTDRMPFLSTNHPRRKEFSREQSQ